MFLNGKAALITGSTSGIGLGIARALAAEGTNLILNGFGDGAEIESLRQEIEKTHKVKVLYSPADMTRPEQIRAMCAAAATEFGSVDILVNNAGIQFVSPVDQFPEEKWDAIIAINLTSTFHTTKAVLAGMKQKKWGRVINIASAHGIVSSPFKSAYCAAKHGILGFSKSVAQEVATDGITVNSICPGYVNTPLVQKQIVDQAKAHGIPESEVIEKIMLAPQPTKKFVEIDEVAALAVYLCRQEAQNITGAELKVDGGWTAR